MSRPIDPRTLAQFTGGSPAPIGMVEINTAEGPVRAWTGIGDLTWGGKVFTGTGWLGGVGPVTEATDGHAAGITFTLSGVDPSIAELAINSIRQGMTATMWLGAVDGQARLVGDPYPLAVMLTDVPTLTDDGSTCTISLTCETRALDQDRARIRRFTTEDQALDDPSDRGFEYVPSLQDAQLLWGTAGLSI